MDTGTLRFNQTPTAERKVVYFDYNATTPYAQTVKDAMISAAERFWGNPSSNYQRGKEAKEAVENARERVAKMIGADPSEIVFMSGGTEANNVAIMSAIEDFQDYSKKPHVISTKIEHDATLKVLQHLERENKIQVTYVPTHSNGSVGTEIILESVTDDTALVTLMLANNETGAILDLAKLCTVLKKVNLQRKETSRPEIKLHIDAAQAIGKIPLMITDSPVDYLTIVGHKFYGPRIGALYVKEGRRVLSLLKGGGQENGRRSGTENTLCIVGLGEAASLVRDNLMEYNSHFKKMKEYLISSLLNAFPQGSCVINFPESLDWPQLPNTLSVSFPGKIGSRILEKCPQLEASTGAACHSSSNKTTPSSVLLTLLPERQAQGSIRLSVGRETSKEDIDVAVAYLSEAISS